jgi:putative ABC transport system ATP-binding protein
MSEIHNDSALIKLEGISKSYMEGETKHQILENVSLGFSGNKFTALLGKSGSGKSTMLNIISGIDSPDKGDIWIGDTPLTRLSDKERTLFRRNKIGIIFQFFNLIPTLTVLENVTLPKELSGFKKKESNKRGMELLEKVGMENRFNTYPDKLSGGEQQRVAIARALVNNPELILADEPTGNLDTETGKKVLELLLELTTEAGKTMIMVTHSFEILPFADMVYTLQKGNFHLVDKKSLSIQEFQ